MVVRIDKYLWAVRIFKTRNEASIACRYGKIIVNNQTVKPSYAIRATDTIEVKTNPIIRVFEVKELSDKRCGPPLVSSYIREITPTEELEKLKVAEIAKRQNKGNMRPTKKERRQLGKLLEDSE